MTTVNKKYEQAKAKFQIILDEIVKSGILPVEVKTSAADKTITQESLLAEFKENAEQIFTIAVCGEVKAGKSTLLNSLIFRDNILPTFETPNTAKLSFIRQSEDASDYFIVNWYSKEDWNLLQENYPEANRTELNNRMKYSNFRGVTQLNCLGQPPRKIIGFEHLDEYTSAPDLNETNTEVRKGVFLPYVKNLEIYIKNDSLKNLQIVDTPGLNDPNRVNSEETTKWIAKAHAMLYVTPCRFLDREDLKFFEVYKASSSEKSRIFVQNRIDESKTDYINAVSKCKSSREFQNLGLFVSENERVCSYSAKLMLLRYMKDEALSPREKKFRDANASFDADKDHLEDVVSERLFANEGSARVDSLGSICSQVYAAKKEMQGQLLKELEYKIKKRKEPLGQIEVQLKNLQKDSRDINLAISDGKADCIGKIAESVRLIKTLVVNWNDVDFNEEIDSMMNRGGAKTVDAEFPRFWRRTLEKKIDSLESIIVSEVGKIQRDVRRKYSAIIDKIESTIGDDIEGLVVNYADKEWKLNLNACNFLKMDLPDFWHNLFSFKSTISGEIKKSVNQSMEKFLEQSKTIPKFIEERLTACVENTFNEISKKLNFVEEELRKIVNNKNVAEKEILQIQKEISEANKCIEICDTKCSEIKALVMEFH